MLKFIVLSVVLMVGLCSTESQAQCASADCGGVTIDRFYIGENGNLYIGTSGNENLLSCTPVNSLYLELLRTSVHFKETFTLLLTSFRDQRALNIRLASSGSCTIRYVYQDK